MATDVINKKQKLLLETLLTHRPSFIRCFRILKGSYFEPPLDEVVDFVLDHFEQYHSIPAMDVIDAELGVKLKNRELEPGDEQYLLDEIEALCQDSAMEAAIIDSVELLKDRNMHGISERVREALLIKLDSTIGTDLFVDPQLRIENMDEGVEEISIGIDAIDELVNKVRRAELGLFFSATAGGKSVMLANVAERFSKRGYDGIVISLELREELYSKRFDAILTGHDISKHKLLASEIAQSLSVLRSEKGYGRILTKKMRFGTTPSMIRSVVMEYILLYGKAPDYLIVDYLGLMGADSSGMRRDMNKFDEDERKVFGLKDILDEYNMYGFSAGQINRDGYDVVNLSPHHIAGGISVINAADWGVGLVATDEDIDNNQVQAVQMKIRNGGKTTKNRILYRCPHTLRISDKPNNGTTAKPPAGLKLGGKKASEPEGEDTMSAKKKLDMALRTGQTRGKKK